MSNPKIDAATKAETGKDRIWINSEPDAIGNFIWRALILQRFQWRNRIMGGSLVF